MSSIRFSSFGAATMPLSKIVVDKDLDMYGHDISGVDTLRAVRVHSPIDTTAWPTNETLKWGDVGAFSETLLSEQQTTGTATDYGSYTVPHSIKGVFKIICHTKQLSKNCGYRVNGVLGDTTGVVLTAEQEYTFPACYLSKGDVVTIVLQGNSGQNGTATVTFVSDGKTANVAKTFDLTGKWLALGLNMQGLAATVKIQGVEMPYSDYAKYFPIAPAELKIPGGWGINQVRPVIKVYTND